MAERFKQKKLILNKELSAGKLKMATLYALLDDHPYQPEIGEAFGIDKIKNEVINVEFIDTVYHRIKYLIEHNERFSILAQSKHITITESKEPVGDLADGVLIFNFKEYAQIDEVGHDLDCFAIYNAKNSYFDTYDMSKYANRLYKDGLGDLAYKNIEYFRALAASKPAFNKHKSYRLVKNEGEIFLRGITSTDRYFEYGVDFTFVISMLILHRDMKKNPGNNYAITSVNVSESKLEIIVAETHYKDAGDFGKVSSAVKITTNDLGEGSLNYTKIIKVGEGERKSVYLFPRVQEDTTQSLIISHSKKPATVLANISQVSEMLDNTDDYIKELLAVKGIKTPDELRARIVYKLEHKRSAFKDLHDLQDIFKTKIDNEIKAFARLLEMCSKAEELEIDYDLKDKLRYIISDIILSGKK